MYNIVYNDKRRRHSPNPKSSTSSPATILILATSWIIWQRRQQSHKLPAVGLIGRQIHRAQRPMTTSSYLRTLWKALCTEELWVKAPIIPTIPESQSMSIQYRGRRYGSLKVLLWNAFKTTLPLLLLFFSTTLPTNLWTISRGCGLMYSWGRAMGLSGERLAPTFSS